MDFKTLLNNYLDILNCSSSELAKYSNISSSIISRYKTGDRTPKLDSDIIKKIIAGIVEIAKVKCIDNITTQSVTYDFRKVLDDNEIDLILLKDNLNTLIDCLNINISELSRYLRYDPSFLSKIRYGLRKPADTISFINKTCNFIISTYKDKTSINKLCELIQIDSKNNTSIIIEHLKKWIYTSHNKRDSSINNFLQELDTFNLNDYIKSIKFNELKIPNIPFYRIKTNNYYGIEEMKQGELDFFKSTVLSKTNEPIFMCSDMPMEDMAKDVEFGKKWMFAIAMSLKKGLHLNIIHNIDRPFNEMMLGLESWIPIYMTGQVSPYYLNDYKDNYYSHFNYVSGVVALTGECINGNHDKGKYYLTNNKKELDYYKNKCNDLLKKANSLMDIYKIDKSKQYKLFLNNLGEIKENRNRLLSTLPLFTISDVLLVKILKRNKITNKDISNIINYKNKELELINNILLNNTIKDEVVDNNIEDINNNKVYLSLDNIFYNKKILYNYDEYKEHLKQTIKYSKNNNNYTFNINKNSVFHNIKINIVYNNFVIISKIENPVIHFIIRHPKLRNAIENFKPLVKED